LDDKERGMTREKPEVKEEAGKKVRKIEKKGEVGNHLSLAITQSIIL
jgi:hypothetical protein